MTYLYTIYICYEFAGHLIITSIQKALLSLGMIGIVLG